MLVFLLMLLQGVLDLGRAFFTYLALKDASADGVYFAAVYPKCIDGPLPGNSHNVSVLKSADDITGTAANTACKDPNNTDYRARKSAPSGGLVDWTNATVDISYTASPTGYVSYTAGSLVTVTISYGYQLLTPLISAIVQSQTLTLYSQSVGIIIAGPDSLP